MNVSKLFIIEVDPEDAEDIQEGIKALKAQLEKVQPSEKPTTVEPSHYFSEKCHVCLKPLYETLGRNAVNTLSISHGGFMYHNECFRNYLPAQWAKYMGYEKT